MKKKKKEELQGENRYGKIITALKRYQPDATNGPWLDSGWNKL